MLGHILRGDENTATQLAFTFAVECDKLLTGRVGRPRSNNFILINNELSQSDLRIDSLQSLTKSEI